MHQDPGVPALFFLVLCVVVLIKVTWDGRRASASRHWPMAPGRIIAASVGTFRGARGTAWPCAEVAYEYIVEGRRYVGSRLWFGYSHHASREEAEQAIAPYSPDAAVEVRHHPTRLELSVLEPGKTDSGATAVGILVALGVVSILVMLASWL